ncbi:MAG: hypothetical protein ACP5N3_03290 [Candidatus Nanoarchaeia archaeon]
MKKLTILLLIILILPVFAYAENNLTCDYTETVKIGEKQISVLYVDGHKENNPLEIKNFKNIQDWLGRTYSQTFEVHNLLDIPVNTTIKFEASLTTYTQNQEIQAHSFGTFGNVLGIDQNTITFIYEDNNYSEGKWKTENIYQTNCSECPEGSGQICLDDGADCSENNRCGSGHCVEGRCTDIYPLCYNEDCRCEQDEVQCANATMCVKTASVNLGDKPICSVKECMYHYVDSEGYCRQRLGGTCHSGWECESGYCVRDYCSTGQNGQGTCYMNDCKCAEDEVQCSDNTKCVKKESVSTGSSILCSREECKSETYKNITRKWDLNGICTEHPDITKQKELDNKRKQTLLFSTIGGVFLIIITITFIFLFRQIRKTTKETNEVKIKLLDKEIDAIKNKTSMIEKEIEKTQADIEKTQASIKYISELKTNLKSLHNTISDLESKKNKEESDYLTLKELREEEQKKLKIVKEEQESVKKTLEYTKTQINIMTGQLSDLQKEKGQIEKDYKILKNKKNKTQNEIKQMSKKEEEIEKLNKKIQDANSKLEQTETKYHEESEKLNNIKKEQEDVKQNLEDIKNVVEKLKKEYSILHTQLKELKKKKNQSKQDLDEIIQIENQLKRKKDLIEEYIKPEKSTIMGKDVYHWRNPGKDYYPCFANRIKNTTEFDLTDKEIHLWVAENIYKNHKKEFEKIYPKYELKELVVHHIDNDKDNYSENNLAIITKEQHTIGIKHGKIIRGNRESGINELKRLNIKQPHIPELSDNKENKKVTEY